MVIQAIEGITRKLVEGEAKKLQVLVHPMNTKFQRVNHEVCISDVYRDN